MARPFLVALVGAWALLASSVVKPVSAQSPAAKATGAELLRPIAMPPDRAADSYPIYAKLIPVGELGNPRWPHDLYLLEDTTVALVKPDEPCGQLPGKSQFAGFMNPHEALHAPADQAQNLAELLEDFDRHCHERIRLTADGFKLKVPLRLLNEVEQNEFQQTRSNDKAPAELKAKYQGASGVSSFSQVYFNAHHTVAMVYASGWCGNLCANGFWAVYGLDETGQWKPLRWSSTFVIS